MQAAIIQRADDGFSDVARVGLMPEQALLALEEGVEDSKILGGFDTRSARAFL